MNYQKHYDALILRAQSRTLETYTERHHILPKSLGGTDDATNIVSLTAEEHYLAHQLLVKIYEKLNNQYAYRKMLFALNLMSGKSNLCRSNRYYGWIRRKVSEARKGFTHTQESKDKNSQSCKKYYKTHTHPRKGKPLSATQRDTLSQILTGRQISNQHKNRISQSLKGIKRIGKPSEANPSYKHISEAVIDKIVTLWLNGCDLRDICSEVDLGAEKIKSLLQGRAIDVSVRQCLYCKKIGDSGNLLRWHFDNCKFKCT